MHRALLAFAQTLLIEPRCPICDGPWDSPMRPAALCSTCLDALTLPLKGLKGLLRLPRCALGPYAGTLRQLLLQVRQPRQGIALVALVQLLSDRLPLPATAVLVPIPSWKRQRSNPLPQQIALGLGRPTAALLHRTHAGLSQHHLNKTQRQNNLIGAFQAIPLDKQGSLGSVWLVDDILTTGSTALAAHEALENAGHHVAGLICLGRNPAKERRR
ncbi:ComF family protein [Synechococcus sp. MU1642]|uniref:ComF family protein n=1 Tax=Synechococcus sp. MU1642 TaxID=2508348 RepID=UPI001CF85EA8|nr:ComF family protein [Synechococcus sp. MU1642]MCB4407781.1 ComF family protein [Synechococcus sp. MU1642]